MEKGLNEEEIIKKYKKQRSENQKLGMQKKAERGELVARPPFGYNLVGGKLTPSQNWREVEDIFNEFLNEKVSLRKLAKKHSFSVNGLKKILTNFTYIGKIKFDGQVHEGSHQPLISSTLFNHVQNKLKNVLKSQQN